jgi:hypothetical protein
MLVTLGEQRNRAFCHSMLRDYNLEDLLVSSSVCEETAFLNGIQRLAGVSLLEKVVVVWELAENCCG